MLVFSDLGPGDLVLGESQGRLKSHDFRLRMVLVLVLCLFL